MERVTTERVIESFKATGFKPIQGSYGRETDGTKYVCGLGAVAIHENRDKVKAGAFCYMSVTSMYAINLMGLDQDYGSGFRNGWDNEAFEAIYGMDKESYDTGYKDGEKAWWAVAGAGLVDGYDR